MNPETYDIPTFKKEITTEIAGDGSENKAISGAKA